MIFFGLQENDYAQVIETNRKKLERILGTLGSCYYLDGIFYVKYLKHPGSSIEWEIAPKYSIIYRVGNSVYNMKCADFNQLITTAKTEMDKTKAMILNAIKEED